MAGKQPLKLKGPQPRPCPGAVELADKPGDFRMCQDVTEEFLCPKHWSRVSSETRRAFNAERNRQREERQYVPSPLMRKLIEAALTESAIRLKPNDPPPVVEVAPHAFRAEGQKAALRFVSPAGLTIAAAYSLHLGKAARRAAELAVILKAKDEGFEIEASDLTEDRLPLDGSTACAECGRVEEDLAHLNVCPNCGRSNPFEGRDAGCAVCIQEAKIRIEEGKR